MDIKRLRNSWKKYLSWSKRNGWCVANFSFSVKNLISRTCRHTVVCSLLLFLKIIIRLVCLCVNTTSCSSYGFLVIGVSRHKPDRIISSIIEFAGGDIISSVPVTTKVGLVMLDSLSQLPFLTQLRTYWPCFITSSRFPDSTVVKYDYSMIWSQFIQYIWLPIIHSHWGTWNK